MPQWRTKMDIWLGDQSRELQGSRDPTDPNPEPTPKDTSVRVTG